MAASSYLLFFFSSLGAFNGVLLALWLLTRNNKQAADNWLAILLILLSVRIGKSIAFYFNPDLDKNILQLGLTACVLIGPAILTFSAHQILPSCKQRIITGLFLVVALTIVSVGILTPYKTHLELWQVWIYRGSSYLWAGCLLLSAWLHFTHWQTQFNKPVNLLKQQSFVVIVGCGLIWLAYFTASYTSYIMGALSFSLVLYLTVLLALKHKSSQHETRPEKYATSKLTQTQIDEFSATLDELIAQEQLFLDPQLTLPRLAKRGAMTHTQLSQLLNDHYQLNFKQYINSHRIEYAKQLLLRHPDTTVDYIAERCGFSAPSTFYTVFKQHTKLTPKAYRTSKI